MQLFESLEALDGADLSAGVHCAIGVFDGVHLAHQAILADLVREARAAGRLAAVFTFRGHPLETLAPSYAPAMLMSAERKAEVLGAAGLDVLALIDFAAEFAAIPYEAFVRDVLLGKLRLKKLYCGFNFRFGHRGAGNVGQLKQLSRGGEFELEIYPPFIHGSYAVSSSHIRDLIGQGRIREASALLSRPHQLTGVVAPGEERGRTLGFPTANVEVEAQRLLPAGGVYAVAARAGEGADARLLGGMMNLGPNPTFGEEQIRFEVHLFDFDGDLYGQKLTVLFLDRLRDVKRFDSPEALVAQLGIDERAARRVADEYLRRRGNDDRPEDYSDKGQ